jgi:DNA-binding CsgD family transcriptional regulator
MKRVSASQPGLFCREKLECLQLSPCELNIARLLAWGLTQKEIANKLHRSTFTVNTQMKHIYAQLGIHKETDLTRWYIFKEYHILGDPFKHILAVLFDGAYRKQHDTGVSQRCQVTGRKV